MGLQELGGWEDSHKESVEGTANITLNIFIKPVGGINLVHT